MKPEKHKPAASQDEWLGKQLQEPEMAVAYLNAALAEGDQAAFMLALRNVAKARGGVAAMARETGMNRVALSRALSGSGNPELRSLTKILDASGLQFVVASKPQALRARRIIRGRKHTASSARETRRIART